MAVGNVSLPFRRQFNFGIQVWALKLGHPMSP
jgi:hypothetical protein